MMISSKLRKWADPASGREGLIYWCQGCNSSHSITTKGAGAWGWNGDTEKPVFSPSVLVTGVKQMTDEQHDAYLRTGVLPPAEQMRCHTFVGCNGAQPGEVIFLSDCAHALAGTVQPFPDLPEHMRD
jgi:hypothetical protein